MTPEQITQDADTYRTVLNDLVNRGADLARRVHEQALGVQDALGDRTFDDPIIAFERIARTVRRTIALARHIAADPALTRHAPPTLDRTTARAQLIRGVEDAIHRKREQTGADRLHAELAERLDDPALEFELDTRPIPELIEELCRDLGVADPEPTTPAHKRRTPQQIADLRARAAAPPARPAPTLQLVRGGRAGGRTAGPPKPA